MCTLYSSILKHQMDNARERHAAEHGGRREAARSESRNGNTDARSESAKGKGKCKAPCASSFSDAQEERKTAQLEAEDRNGSWASTSATGAADYCSGNLGACFPLSLPLAPLFLPFVPGFPSTVACIIAGVAALVGVAVQCRVATSPYRRPRHRVARIALEYAVAAFRPLSSFVPPSVSPLPLPSPCRSITVLFRVGLTTDEMGLGKARCVCSFY
ncbi:hypothetical protein C8R45DRAFT_1102976 [Mycena sanguinolenta]|nr:hypothetical protein C8R45DRAFT_1102976 [Mycena sanguinolenta]